MLPRKQEGDEQAHDLLIRRRTPVVHLLVPGVNQGLWMGEGRGRGGLLA